eukprot:TRINITY_DN4955_c0_g1_i2.p1 TRINITY_DN4955_c0_g1~~TRINITY_DN4955_c0_g1_i2.p1  ORF type:complete len:351 (+),score=52.87 TRINITY_DN4955_c0_g1_i2:139-1191(+)
MWQMDRMAAEGKAILAKLELRQLLTGDEFCELVNSAYTIFCSEPPVLHIPSPVCVIGDIHGSFGDLLHALDRKDHITENSTSLEDTSPEENESEKTPDVISTLFLGDLVDRGANSIECLAYVLALKLVSPKTTFLIRGNHEDMGINESYGFCSEIKATYGDSDRFVFSALSKLWSGLPVAAVIEDRVGNRHFCAHGGIFEFTSATDLQDNWKQLLEFKKRENSWTTMESFTTRAGKKKMRHVVIDILWSDPKQHMHKKLFQESERGLGKYWSEAATVAWCNGLNFAGIIRAHETVDGISSCHNKKSEDCVFLLRLLFNGQLRRFLVFKQRRLFFGRNLEPGHRRPCTTIQ